MPRGDEFLCAMAIAVQPIIGALQCLDRFLGPDEILFFAKVLDQLRQAIVSLSGIAHLTIERNGPVERVGGTVLPVGTELVRSYVAEIVHIVADVEILHSPADAVVTLLSIGCLGDSKG